MVCFHVLKLKSNVSLDRPAMLETLLNVVRALSELQESAQLLTGDALPMAVIEALLAESPKVGEKIAVLNLSPYDACVELVALKWHMDNPDRRIRSLSLSTDMTVVGHTEKTVALALMEARPRCCYHM